MMMTTPTTLKVRRRFSEFVELASSLHSAWPLPPRGIMGNTILGLTPAELAGRATALESFLQHLVDTVKEFVEFFFWLSHWSCFCCCCCCCCCFNNAVVVVVDRLELIK